MLKVLAVAAAISVFYGTIAFASANAVEGATEAAAQSVNVRLAGV